MQRTEAIRQRQPRIEEPSYLAYVRTFPCLVCGKPGPSDAAHLRSSALRYGKRHTGMGEKPDDRWTLPLCRKHHEEQHRENELAWWAGQGLVDPFAVAIALYASRPGATKPRTPKPFHSKATRARKPPEERKAIQNRETVWPSRKFPSRNNLHKEKHQ